MKVTSIEGLLCCLLILVSVTCEVQGGYTELHRACKDGNPRKLKQLLAQNLNINEADSDDETPLMVAVQYCGVKCVQILLDQGASVEGQNIRGWTPVLLAARYCGGECVKILLDKGASVQGHVQDDWTPVMTAARYCGAECVKILVDKGASVQGKTQDEWTPVMLSARYCGVECVKILLDKGASVQGKDLSGNTPVILAAQYCGVECVKILVDKEASVKGQDQNGVTPVMLATRYCGVECVKILIDKGASVQGQDQNGWTPVMIAGQYCGVECVKNLIENGASVKGQDQHGYTPVMLAAPYCGVECVKILLDKGASGQGKTRDGWTPVMLATRYSSGECVKILIDKGASVQGKNQNGWTPVMIAARYCDVECVKILVDKGASVQGKTPDGTTALMLSCYGNNSESAYHLLYNNANMNLRNNAGQTAEEIATYLNKTDHVNVFKLFTDLHQASRMGDVQKMKSLIDSNPNFDARDSAGNTPLMLSCLNSNPESTYLLLNSGASVTIRNNKGQTAYDIAMSNNNEGHLNVLRLFTELHQASRQGDVQKLKELLDAKPNVDSRDSAGNTPLMLSCLNSNPESTYLLLNSGASVTIKNNKGQTASDIALSSNKKEHMQVFRYHAGKICYDQNMTEVSQDTVHDGKYICTSTNMSYAGTFKNKLRHGVGVMYDYILNSVVVGEWIQNNIVHGIEILNNMTQVNSIGATTSRGTNVTWNVNIAGETVQCSVEETNCFTHDPYTSSVFGDWKIYGKVIDLKSQSPKPDGFNQLEGDMLKGYGEWIWGEREGFGVTFHKTDGITIGNLHQNYLHLYGASISPSDKKAVYVGQYHYGQQSGFGMYWYKNGAHTFAKFGEGMMIGKGIYIRPGSNRAPFVW